MLDRELKEKLEKEYKKYWGYWGYNEAILHYYWEEEDEDN